MYGQLLLREAYDVSVGIFDHVLQATRDKETRDPGSKRPLALVAMHPSEDTSGAINIQTVAKLFADLKIGERFNISFVDYLGLPASYCRELIAVAEECQKRDLKITQNLEKSAT